MKVSNPTPFAFQYGEIYAPIFTGSSQRKRSETMADRNLTCRDCGSDFVFTEGEQAFYAEKGFTNDPVRCKSCRSMKKSRNNERGGARGSFNNQRYSRY